MKYINVYVSVNYFQSERENFLRFLLTVYMVNSTNSILFSAGSPQNNFNV